MRQPLLDIQPQADIAQHRVTTWQCGRAGRVLRCVLGAATLPLLDFLAPDAPAWSDGPDVDVVTHGSDADGFELLCGDKAVLRGRANLQRWSIEVDVGAAAVYGFGAANGAPTRNDSRFRVLALDTLLYGIAGSVTLR